MPSSRSLMPTRVALIALVLAISALQASLLVTPALGQERDDEAALRESFAILRTTIEERVPLQLQPAFLAPVDAAQFALLLPAVQAARETARQSDCAAVHILSALQQNQRAGEFTHRYTFGYDVSDAAAVDAAIEEVLRLIEDALVCARGA